MTVVKICGIKRVDDARAVAAAGADLIGFVFAQSRRRVTPEAAEELAHAVRSVSSVKTVGVFVHEDPQRIDQIARQVGLDYIQLSGHEEEDAIAKIDLPVVHAIHVDPGMSPEDLADRIDRSPAEIVLLDTARAGAYGGTGATFDWDRVQRLSRPVLLAGGLHPGNIAQAIERVQPWGVDVSSGVETGGEKDRDKILEFVRRARDAEVRESSGIAAHTRDVSTERDR
jgi:phosphoribosylanthranilate isomerase